MPKSRLDFWKQKFEANQRRDQINQTKLHELGWKILIIWECQLKESDELTRRIREFLE